jgi:GAF domain-containing protein
VTEETTGQEAVPLVVQLGQLARSDALPDQFLKDFFRLVHAAMAAQAGSLWLHDRENNQLTPKVVHSPEGGPLSALSEENITRIVYRTVEQKQPVLYYGEEDEQSEGERGLCLVAVPTEIDEKVQAVLILARRDPDNTPYRREDVHLVQSLCVYLIVYFTNLKLRQAATSSQRLAVLADIESDLAATVGLEKMAFILANRVREMLFFDRTFVALPRRTGFRIPAISGVDDVSQQTAAVATLRELVRETARIGGDWHFTPSYLEKVEDEVLREKIAAYFETTDYKSVLLMRVEDEGGPLAIIGLERREEGSYAPHDFALLQAFSKASAKALRRAKGFESMPGIFLIRQLDRLKKRVLGPARVRFFLKIAAVLAVAAFLVFGRWNLNVKGRCEIVPYVRALAAPRYQGKIVEITKNEGDFVSAGDVIAVMDDREVRNRIRKTNLELGSKELARDAATEPAAVSLVNMEIDILRAVLEGLQLQRDGLKITSPIDGVITTPRDQINASLNSVRNAGEPICEIAQVSRLYLEVEIAASDVRFVEKGQSIRFALAGAPNVAHSATITEISPATRVVRGGNFFVVRAVLESPPRDGAFRLGNSGSASIDAGRRHVLFVLFRSTIERLRSLFL